jgi:hypothetical protein
MTATLTFDEILESIQARRPCSPESLRRYLRKLKILPVGELRTRPRHYPGDSASKVLTALGDKVVTLSQLKAERAKAQRARAA